MAALSGVAGVTGSAAVRRDPGRITSCPRLVLQAILYLLFPVDAAWSPSFWGGAQYGGWRRRAKVRAFITWRGQQAPVEGGGGRTYMEF